MFLLCVAVKAGSSIWGRRQFCPIHGNYALLSSNSKTGDIHFTKWLDSFLRTCLIIARTLGVAGAMARAQRSELGTWKPPVNSVTR